MLCNIENDEEKKLWLHELKMVTEVIVKQKSLPRDARVGGSVLEKLEQLHDYLESEILKYDKLQEE